MEAERKSPLPAYLAVVETAPLKGPAEQRPMEPKGTQRPHPLSTVHTADDAGAEGEHLLDTPTSTGPSGNQEDPCSTCCSWLDALLARCCGGSDDE